MPGFSFHGLQFPVVGTEGCERDAAGVEDRADAPVTEAVADGHGFRDFGARYDVAGAVFLAGFGGVEYFVCAGQLESVYVAAHRVEAQGTDVETDDGFPVLDGEGLVGRRVGLDALHAVIVLQGEEGETLAHRLLPAGVDGAVFADIDGGGHAAVGNGLQGFLLRFIEIAAGPVVGFPIGVRRDLDEIERRIRDLEEPS